MRGNVNLANTNGVNGHVHGQVMNAVSQMRFPTSPFIFGCFDATRYYRTLNSTCCADTGLDLAAMEANSQYSYIDSRIMANALESLSDVDDKNALYIMAPGSVQHVTFNRFEGWDQFDGTSEVYRTIQSPFTGQTYDLYMKLDCGVIYAQLIYNGDIFFLPDNYFAEDDDMTGVNFTSVATFTNTAS